TPAACAGPPTIVDQNMAFGASPPGTAFSTVGTVSFTVPCGPYTCITARDRLHTLRRTIVLAGAGPNYTASFTAANSKALKGGNLNDDAFVDILDFAIFVGQFFQTKPASTPCGTAGPHANFNGDTTVNTADFTFIS